MKHIMKLNSDEFYRMKSGIKEREYRLYDSKRRLVNIGDTILFKKLPGLEDTVEADVRGIEIFSNWEDCYDKYFDIEFSEMYDSIDDILDDTYTNYYSKEESDLNGVVVFTLKRKNFH